MGPDVGEQIHLFGHLDEALVQPVCPKSAMIIVFRKTCARFEDLLEKKEGEGGVVKSKSIGFEGFGASRSNFIEFKSLGE